VADVRKAPGFIAGIAMTERPFIEVATFTVWQSRDDATNFAYRRRPHQEIVAQNERQRIMKAFSKAYFYPKRSAGTWRGQDPLSVARREPNVIAQNGES
jgi:heme-degrading monooxygenase HmoA